MALEWQYERLKEDGSIQIISSDFTNDTDRKITGKIVMNVKAYFDENPDEWKRLGFTRHILHQPKEIEFNPQTQFVVMSTKQVDEYTIEDTLFVIDKSEEQLAFEEMLAVCERDTITFE